MEAREVSESENFVPMSLEEMHYLCEKSKEIFLKEPTLLELQAPINICGKRKIQDLNDGVFPYISSGNIHGQYPDLLRHMDQGGFPPQSNYLFLGGYVDRGKRSLETICLLLAYKVCSCSKQSNHFSSVE